MKLVRLIFSVGVIFFSGIAFSANVMILGPGIYKDPDNIPHYSADRIVPSDLCLIWMAKTDKQFDNELIDSLTKVYFGELTAVEKIKYEKEIRKELEGRLNQIKSTQIFGFLGPVTSRFDSINKTFVYSISELDSQAGECKWPARDEWSFDTKQDITIRMKMGENDLPWVDVFSKGENTNLGMVDFGRDGVYTIAWVKFDKPKTTKTKYVRGAGYLPSLPWRLIGVHTIVRQNGQTGYFGSDIKEKGFTTKDAIHEFERQILVDFKVAKETNADSAWTQDTNKPAIDADAAKKVFDGLKSIFGR